MYQAKDVGAIWLSFMKLTFKCFVENQSSSQSTTVLGERSLSDDDFA